MAFDITSVFGVALNFVLFTDSSRVHSYVSFDSTWFWAHASQYGQNCMVVTSLFLKLCATPRLRDTVDVLVGKGEREKRGWD